MTGTGDSRYGSPDGSDSADGSPGPVDDNARLVESGDLDELTRQVERLCAVRDWEGLVDLHHRCRQALERGKQLWPVASHCEYRLALEAPGPWAAHALTMGTGQFGFGPLPEVAACRHTWHELSTAVEGTAVGDSPPRRAASAGSLPPTVERSAVLALTAHERVVRTEDLRADPVVPLLPPVLDLPWSLQLWEPTYPLAEYHTDRVAFPSPPLTGLGHPEAPAPRGTRCETLDDPDATGALRDLAETWVTESNGRAEAVCVRGDALGAVRSLGAPRPRLQEIAGSDALALMAWTAASGGAHGRRRGMAAGRFAAWWTVAALGGLTDDWPVPAEEIGDVVQALCWYRWDVGEPETGWVLRLAAADPDEGLAWVVAATDSA